jgi:hypothetical protein
MGYQVVDWIADYYKNRIEALPVKPNVQPGYLRPLLPDAAPDKPESFDAVMADFEDKLMPGVMHWQSPRWALGVGGGGRRLRVLMARQLTRSAPVCMQRVAVPHPAVSHDY